MRFSGAVIIFEGKLNLKIMHQYPFLRHSPRINTSLFSICPFCPCFNTSLFPICPCCTLKRHYACTQRRNKILTEHKTSYFGWWQINVSFSWSNRLCLIHICLYFADDGSLQWILIRDSDTIAHFKFRNIIFFKLFIKKIYSKKNLKWSDTTL